MKILIDMNLAPSWAPVLGAAGFDAVHWSTVGPADAPDSALFAWAREHGYVVFTHDLDFGAMLAATRAESPSVFQIRTQNVAPAALSQRAIALMRRFEYELENGALIVVDELRERIRLLPLGPS
jgi:predicted nuclease of predicted toxin-antitoxin system